MSSVPTLTRVKRLDSIPLEKVEYTQEGFLIDTPVVTSVGIFEYRDADGKAHRELRLPEHVFAEPSLATYEGKPIIITHEAGRVSKDNVTEEIVGTILSKGYRDGDDVRAKIVIHDIDAVKRSGLRELSLGYDLVLDETPGEWNGQPYDAIQTEIVVNHLAIVRAARAGEQARLNIDSKEKQNNAQEGAKEMAGKTEKGMNTDEANKKTTAYTQRRKRRLDEAEARKTAATGNADSADNESEIAGEIRDNKNASTETSSVEDRLDFIKDRRDRRDAAGDADDLEAAKAAIAEQDEDIQQLIEIVEEMQAASDLAAADSGPDKQDEDDPEKQAEGGGEKPMNADSVDAVIAERLRLGRIGDRLHLDGLETLKPLEAKKKVIQAIKPDLRLDGKSNHYINTAFDIAVQEMDTRKDTEYQRKQIFNADSRHFADTDKSKSQQAREKMLARMQNGGK